MDYWSILVFTVLNHALNDGSDLVAHHVTVDEELRELMGIKSVADGGKEFTLQTIIRNLTWLDEETLVAINLAIVKHAHLAIGVVPSGKLKGRADSFVAWTDVDILSTCVCWLMRCEPWSDGFQERVANTASGDGEKNRVISGNCGANSIEFYRSKELTDTKKLCKISLNSWWRWWKRSSNRKLIFRTNQPIVTQPRCIWTPIPFTKEPFLSCRKPVFNGSFVYFYWDTLIE